MKYEDLELRSLKGRKVIIRSPEEGNTGIGGAWVEGVGETDAGSFSIGAGKGSDLIRSGRFDGIEIDPDYFYEYFHISRPVKGTVVLDKASSQAIKDYCQAKWEARLAEVRLRWEAEEAALEAAVPGVTELRAAIHAMHSYQEDFAAAMEDEMRDGVNMPVAPRADIDALAAQYPRANLYLKAEGYADASHYAKASAGRKAMTLLREGGTIEEAAAILDSWLNDVYVD